MNKSMTVAPTFDVDAARRRCRNFRRRILDISQKVSAIHIAPAFSCLEIVDAIYFGLLRRNADGSLYDNFLLSKGHGSAAQYVVLEELGILSKRDMDLFCQPGGKLGTHPDYGTPGIEASTGSLGHGLPVALGMALADKAHGLDRCIYVVLSDGEVQEGSTWEALMLAPSLKLNNLVAFIDLNDFQTMDRTSNSHPNFYPISDKMSAFGWDTVEVNGHEADALVDVVASRRRTAPMMVVARTTKGKGVSYMEDVPLWHYRSPNADEYKQAVQEVGEAA